MLCQSTSQSAWRWLTWQSEVSADMAVNVPVDMVVNMPVDVPVGIKVNMSMQWAVCVMRRIYK